MKEWFNSGQENVIEACELKEDDWLLDVGCGTGWAVIQAAQLVPGGKACGIDISPGMAFQATRAAAGIPNVEIRTADAEAIPYPDEHFNAIMCTSSFSMPLVYHNPSHAARFFSTPLDQFTLTLNSYTLSGNIDAAMGREYSRFLGNCC